MIDINELDMAIESSKFLDVIEGYVPFGYVITDEELFKRFVEYMNVCKAYIPSSFKLKS